MSHTTRHPDTRPACGDRSVHVEPLLDCARGKDQRNAQSVPASGPARTPAALLVSATLHALVIGVVLVGFRHAPTATEGGGVVRPRIIGAVVWNGGGGGGGGRGDSTPARRAESPGSDAMTLQVMPAAPVRPPDPATPKDMSPVAALLDLPFQALSAGVEAWAGTPDGIPGGRSLGPGSGDGAGSGRGSGIGPGDGPGAGPGSGGNTGGGPRGSGTSLVLPRLVREVKPLYTPDAMRAHIQGTAIIDCLVTTDGAVADVRLVQSIDREWGLDEEAIKAARQWRFIPGTLNGQPIPMRVRIELQFSLQ